MARKAIDPNLRQIRTQVTPPEDLHPVLLELWNEQFARFPRGWFVPSDMRSMVTYLEILRRYRQLSAICDDALAHNRVPDKAAMVALGQVTTHVMRMQSALKMYPASRASKDAFGSLSRDPGAQQAPVAGWRGVMQQARDAQTSNVTELPVKKRGPGRPRKVNHAAP